MLKHTISSMLSQCLLEQRQLVNGSTPVKTNTQYVASLNNPWNREKMDVKKSTSEKSGLLSKAWRILKQKGIRYLAGASARRIRVSMRESVLTPLSYEYYRFFKTRKTFTFQQKKYRYFFHRYNQTWRNERAVEIPIIWSIVQASHGCILEVGNVLSHYFPINHDVVDKYEKARGVINQDVTEIAIPKKYDLIVSISTLEHVGWDENPTDKKTIDDPEKILVAMSRLKSLLKPGGKIIVTLPLDYNPNMDRLLWTEKLRFERTFFMKRVSKDKWTEASEDEARNLPFNRKIPSANALLIGIEAS